ncbi:MAG: GerAB/ArcD/ProY family transporter [Bacilli bacterium]|nr:GerAB/ArcD/ProY family transporter [Bacilli bacterium]
MKDEKINSFILSTILISLCCSTFYGIFSSYIINSSKNSSLISITIGYILSLFVAKLFLSFYKKKEELSITEKIKYLFPKTSTIINIILILCSVFGYVLISYRLTTFLSNQYLVSTPKYIISIIIISLTCYTASKGFNTVIRVSYITFFISIIIFFFDFISLVSYIDLENYLPLINVSYKDIITSSIIFMFYFSSPIIYLNIIPYNKIINKDSFNKFYYIMITTSFIIIFISTFTCIGVNGIRVTELFDYPIYSTLKRIRLFSALDSLENISISAWFLFIINTANMMLTYIFSAVKETFNNKNTIINLIIIVTSFVIPNFIFANNNFNESYDYIYIPIIFAGINISIILLYLVKYKFFQKKRTYSS